MPFITEELWQALGKRNDGESIMVAPMPEAGATDDSFLKAFDTAREIIGGVRAVRLQKNIPNREPLALQCSGEHDARFNPVIVKMCNLKGNPARLPKGKAGVSFLVGATEYTVPFSGSNVKEELAKLQDELNYQQGFLALVMKKLNNESFTAKAPAKVLEAERKKQADTESKIDSLKESIKNLTKLSDK
jgi:valyl-tRNA synthetase